MSRSLESIFSRVVPSDSPMSITLAFSFSDVTTNNCLSLRWNKLGIAITMLPQPSSWSVADSDDMLASFTSLIPVNPVYDVPFRYTGVLLADGKIDGRILAT